jgi:hypothetical protein
MELDAPQLADFARYRVEPGEQFSLADHDPSDTDGISETEELERDFLGRYPQATPANGMIGVFNRSHYEDVLVVRVKDLAPEELWRSRFDSINDFERMLVREGTTIVKFLCTSPRSSSSTSSRRPSRRRARRGRPGTSCPPTTAGIATT